MSKSDALTIDLEDLTIEEVEVLEEITDTALDELFAPGAKKGRVLRALAYIAARRDNPNVTLEEVGSKRLVIQDDAEDSDPS